MCEAAATTEMDDPFNYGLSKVKAAYLPHPNSPSPFATWSTPHVIGTGRGLGQVKAACPYGAIDLDMQPERFDLKVGSIVWATGWEPFDAETDPLLRLRQAQERDHQRDDGAAGVAERTDRRQDPAPLGRQAAEHVAFVQCAGSRDEHHLPYCSGVCCLASLKQATYVRRADPEAEVTIFYIDIRTPGPPGGFLRQGAEGRQGRASSSGKIAEIEAEARGGSLRVRGEDTLPAKRFELAVTWWCWPPACCRSRRPGGSAYDELRVPAAASRRQGHPPARAAPGGRSRCRPRSRTPPPPRCGHPGAEEVLANGKRRSASISAPAAGSATRSTWPPWPRWPPRSTSPRLQDARAACAATEGVGPIHEDVARRGPHHGGARGLLPAGQARGVSTSTQSSCWSG